MPGVDASGVKYAGVLLYTLRLEIPWCNVYIMANVVRPACMPCVQSHGRALVDRPMTRVYIRAEGKFVPAGWLCANGHYSPIVEPWSPTGDRPII